MVEDLEKKTINRRFGANFGATGMTGYLTLTEDEIKVTVNYQY